VVREIPAGSVRSVIEYDDVPAARPLAAPARPATGDQYVIRHGGAVARVGQVGAVLREFSVDGTHYTETWPEAETPPLSCGVVLMPWPNRVADGRWTWNGTVQQLALTEPARGNAIHGLLLDTAYRATGVDEGAVTLTASIYPRHGWPFTLDTAVTYALTDRGLRVTHEVTNVGSGRAVVGCGAHPYLRIGDVPTEELTLTLRAGSVFVTDDRLIPVDKRPLAGDLAALPTGVRLDDLDLDTGFADLRAVPASDGDRATHFEHVLAAPDGRTLTLWADADFAYTIVFTPQGFPNDSSRGPAGVHRAIAVEPMTCPTNALNSGEGLISLEPGGTWRASWGLAPGE